MTSCTNTAWNWTQPHLPTDVQKCWWAFIVFKHRLLRISQHRIERSSLAEIRYLPPGWKTIPRTQLSWPFSTTRQTPTLMSQICATEINKNHKLIELSPFSHDSRCATAAFDRMEMVQPYTNSFVSWTRCQEWSMVCAGLVIRSSSLIYDRWSIFWCPSDAFNRMIMIP